MKSNFSTFLLSKVDRLSRRINPMSLVIDAIVERIAPKTVALATCFYCDYTCDSSQCAEPDKGRYIEYYNVDPQCGGPACNRIDYGCIFC